MQVLYSTGTRGRRKSVILVLTWQYQSEPRPRGGFDHNKQALHYGEFIMTSLIRTKFLTTAALLLCTGAAQAANVAINGDFESGALSPWLAVSNGGTIGIDTPPAGNPSAGSFAAHLTAAPDGSGAQFPILKLERVAAGLLTPNAPVTVSFDLFGSYGGPGAVFVTELFSEKASGATNEILAPNAVPTGTWQTITYSTTLGADVTGGLSLLFKADCGANVGCNIDAYIDNVVIDTAVVPVPAAVWLFGSGLVGLVGVARRKRKAA